MFERLAAIFRKNKAEQPRSVGVEFVPFCAPSPHMDLDEAADRIDGRLRAMGFLPTQHCAKLGSGNTRNAITYSLHKGTTEIIPAKMVYVKLSPEYAGNRDISLHFSDQAGAKVLEIDFWHFIALDNSAELTKEMEQYGARMGYCKKNSVSMDQLFPR